MNRSAVMAPFLPLLLVLLLASGCQANTNELSTSRHAVLGPSLPEGYKPSEGPSATTTGGQGMIKIGPCFPNNGNNGNALSCLKLCTSKGYAGGHCDPLPGGLRGDCYCFTF
ncbi:hypothetical protein BDA96_04G053500 [Sorghum bicolor]|uniref:Knottin scorpion toxin-like domain-containing protein n=2 Tax=Sorghum bicolor TaxID=4558 RepID=A0A921R1Y9_SORBI|nr:hypothetical protein BDA96_04G053500 [Sorghum bicolor]KXG29515.1 hypothetical protein SORBI_3004G048400 [Sorghum bicolor]